MTEDGNSGPRPQAPRPSGTKNADPGWFKRRFEEKGISLREAAKGLGMAPSQLSRAINGLRAFKIGEVFKMARLIGQPDGEIMFRAGMTEDSAFDRAPLCAGHVITEDGALVPLATPVEVTRPSHCGDTTRAAVCAAESGPLAVLRRWVFYYELREVSEALEASQLDTLAITQIKESKELAVRVIRAGVFPGKYDLYAPGGEGPPLLAGVTLRRIGIVEWMRVAAT